MSQFSLLQFDEGLETWKSRGIIEEITYVNMGCVDLKLKVDKKEYEKLYKIYSDDKIAKFRFKEDKAYYQFEGAIFSIDDLFLKKTNIDMRIAGQIEYKEIDTMTEEKHFTTEEENIKVRIEWLKSEISRLKQELGEELNKLNELQLKK